MIKYFKNFSAALAISFAALVGTTAETEARPHINVRIVSGHAACGCPIYKTRSIIGYRRCGRPIYRFARVPFRCGCKARRVQRQRHVYHDAYYPYRNRYVYRRNSRNR